MMKTTDNKNNRKQNETNNLSDYDYDRLMQVIRNKDERFKGINRRFSILMFVMVFIYLALLVVNPDPELDWKYRVSGGFYVLAFMVGAYLFRKEYVSIRKVDYTMPVVNVLQDALNRYRIFKPSFYKFLVVPVLINLGVMFGGSLRYMPSDWTIDKKVLIFQLGYWILMLLAFFVGYFIWLKDTKPSYKKIKEMLTELTSEDQMP